MLRRGLTNVRLDAMPSSFIVLDKPYQECKLAYGPKKIVYTPSLALLSALSLRLFNMVKFIA